MDMDSSDNRNLTLN